MREEIIKNLNFFFLNLVFAFPDEKSDPDLYAKNIAKFVSKETGIPLAERSALDYLEELRNLRGECEELKTTGWKRLFSCGSEMQAVKKSQ